MPHCSGCGNELTAKSRPILRFPSSGRVVFEGYIKATVFQSGDCVRPKGLHVSLLTDGVVVVVTEVITFFLKEHLS